MAKITRVEQAVPTIKTKKKVAAYARISMESERMNHSLSAQISYYSSLIQKNPDWQYAGVFADDGISGTGIAKRDEFKRMIEAADNGEIDIILTKSIQRFARNTVDLLETVRHLKDIGVEVRFEKEHINSMSGDGELMLTILASFAQEESRSLSENCKWGIRKRFEKGIPNGHFRVYGYRWEGDELVIVPEEAAVVRRIFQNFLDGKSRLETEREFAAEGITTRDGCRWVDSNIKVVLTNVTYTGNLLLQKEFISDPISKQRKKNRGQLPQYYVEDTHPAIIDKATFDYVQEEIARRKELGPRANKSLNLTCFSGMLKCPHCGISYAHNKRRTEGSWSIGLAVREEKRQGGGVGEAKKTRKKKKAQVRVHQPNLGVADTRLDEFDEDAFLDKVDFINVPERYVLEFHLKDGAVITKDCPNTGHQDCWTAEYRAKTSEKRRKKPNCKGSSVMTGKIKCAVCGCNFRRASQPSATSESGKAFYWRCAERNGCGTVGLREDVLKPFIAETLGIPKFDDAEFEKRIDHIDVLSASEMVFHFKDGGTVGRTWVQPKRVGRPWRESENQIQGTIKELYA
jgi:DNA invertase Pin-like site-specific DNA recombinase